MPNKHCAKITGKTPVRFKKAHALVAEFIKIDNNYGIVKDCRKVVMAIPV